MIYIPGFCRGLVDDTCNWNVNLDDQDRGQDIFGFILRLAFGIS